MQVLRPGDGFSELPGCSLIPTMGALHEGHASLIRRSAADGDHVVVTIFVNPTQFGASEDLSRYPRSAEADLELCRAAGASVVLLLTEEQVYPEGLSAAHQAAATWQLPLVATTPQLEDRSRPTHFGGVCQVVSRLLDLTQPSKAYFGEKDWQQLLVIERMIDASAGRWGDLLMIRCPTVREPDGLALSSRNRFLSVPQRAMATSLVEALRLAGRMLEGPATVPEIEGAMARHMIGRGLEVDYAVARFSYTLSPIYSGCFPTGTRYPMFSVGIADRVRTPVRLLIAAKIGTVRLIDNCEAGDTCGEAINA